MKFPIDPSLICKARLLVKDEGIIAGLELASRIFLTLDPAIQIKFFKADGDVVHAGETAFEVVGKAQVILTAERFVLNCMQRMSGIATYTHHLCLLISGTKASLIDTRKTTPNFRLMEKWAVVIGGGKNHRFALYDMVMLKDNHVDLAGGITNAVRKVTAYLKEHKKTLLVEVETRNLTEVKEAVSMVEVNVIMLDNMSLAEVRQAVQLIDGKCLTEASGGITEQTLKSVAECGVDFISVGALTHSVKSLDLSLKVVK